MRSRLSQIDPGATERAGERAIHFLLEMLYEPMFWVLLVVVVLGATLIRHGWPWRKTG